MEMNALIVAVMTMLAVGGIFYVLVYPLLSGDAKAAKRQSVFSNPAKRKAADKQADAAMRRKQIVDSLKDVEARAKTRKITLENRIAQAGLRWSRSRFFMFSGVCGVIFGLLTMFVGKNMILALVMIAVGALGFPRWLLQFLRKRRLKKFVGAFPEAIDIIIRGVKAGLPLHDCLRIVANESSEPVRSEFRRIVEAQAIGLSVSEAAERLPISVPIPEANFFAIVIAIQQKAGGNLSDALSNLSTVLRERKKMKGKIQAFSSEARASAMIIGCLPFAVGGMVYLTSPKYIELLWKTSTGEMVMMAAGLWMLIGIFVMRQMINFDI